ncbi:MAG: hypothetical protein GMKNLPBB_03023 [Myxococcota bacterium]|nr:hypothetical protein [Myxococcota bacterium]
MKFRSFFLMMILGLLGVLNACASNNNQPADGGVPAGDSGPGGSDASAVDETLIKSSKSRLMAPKVEPADAKALEEGNAAFAWSLFKQLREEKGNLFFSPASVSIALAMTSAGAKAGTLSEMEKALQFRLPQPRLHPAFNQLDLALESRGAKAPSKDDGEPFRLSIANALWGAKGMKFLDPFLDTLAENYGAGMHVLDFKASPEKARETINDWVANKTGQKIKDLLPQGSIKPDTSLVLTNAIYFKANWLRTFAESDTKPGDFTTQDGVKKSVPVMKQSATMMVGEYVGFQAVRLPYAGNEVSMWLFQAPEGNFEGMEQSFDSNFVDGLIRNAQIASVELTLPKWKAVSQFSLAAALQKLGMPVAFSDGADFSGMTADARLRIADVIHKAFVEVNEKGTEAAAATGVIMEPTSAPGRTVKLNFDRPFLYVIRDDPTGAILFVGRVSDPAM